jgi:integrase
MEWIDDNPMKRTRGVTVWAEDDDLNATLPIDEEGDANYRKICETVIPFLRNEIDRPGRQRKRERRGAFLSRPENFLALIHLLYETGMRISDAVFFDPAKIAADERGATYTFRPIKTRKRSKKKVTAFLDDKLADELRGLEKLDKAHPFFDGREDWRTFINNNIRPVMAELGDAIGVPGLRPHRFRDSFAVNRLNEGVDIYDLKELLGHASVAMTERYYAPWVKSRTISLQQRLQAAREAAARNVVSIRKAG